MNWKDLFFKKKYLLLKTLLNSFCVRERDLHLSKYHQSQAQALKSQSLESISATSPGESSLTYLKVSFLFCDINKLPPQHTVLKFELDNLQKTFGICLVNDECLSVF